MALGVSSSDRRLGRRFNCDLGMSITSSGDFSASGRITDISSIGARMELMQEESARDSSHADAIPPGARISVSIMPRDKTPIALEARIVWRKRRIFGVAFVGVPEDSRSRLWNLLVDTALKERASTDRHHRS